MLTDVLKYVIVRLMKGLKMTYLLSQNSNNSFKNKDLFFYGGGYCLALTYNQIKFLTTNIDEVSLSVFFAS